MAKYLLIGGSHDGERREVDLLCGELVLTPKGPIVEGMTLEHYVLHEFTGGLLLAIRHIGRDRVIQLLVKGYRKGTPE